MRLVTLKKSEGTDEPECGVSMSYRGEQAKLLLYISLVTKDKSVIKVCIIYRVLISNFYQYQLIFKAEISASCQQENTVSGQPELPVFSERHNIHDENERKDIHFSG